jgi:DNA-binding Lrp family transcriptional regulator
MLPQNLRVGEVEKKIIHYLGNHLDVMATQIVRDLGLDRSNLSKQLRKLKEDGFIDKPYTQTSVKNQDRDIWRLTVTGMGYVMINSNYSAPEIRAMMEAYQFIYPEAAMLLSLINAVHEAVGNGDDIMGVFYKSVASLFEGGVDYLTTVNAVEGILRNRMGQNNLDKVARKLGLHRDQIFKRWVPGVAQIEVCHVRARTN